MSCESWAPGARAMPWVLRDDPPMIGADNMAADEAALEAQRAADAIPVVRVFRWASPALSFGRLQDAHEAANQSMLQGCGAMVRRPTGGGMVVHRDDLSFSVAWRRGHPSFPDCVKTVYRAIHDVVRAGLAARGLETAFHDGTARAGLFCFQAPAEGDLLWNGKKILGGALRVTSWGRLYQGDLLTGLLGLERDAAARMIAAAFEGRFFKTAPTPLSAAPPAS